MIVYEKSSTSFHFFTFHDQKLSDYSRSKKKKKKRGLSVEISAPTRRFRKFRSILQPRAERKMDGRGWLPWLPGSPQLNFYGSFVRVGCDLAKCQSERRRGADERWEICKRVQRPPEHQLRELYGPGNTLLFPIPREARTHPRPVVARTKRARVAEKNRRKNIAPTGVSIRGQGSH